MRIKNLEGSPPLLVQIVTFISLQLPTAEYVLCVQLTCDNKCIT